ncbi:MAG TPA: Crp/Fnr family transcriptional regulator [Sphingomonas sp.]|nr:Crp/Fnr family transcriptional regulator [Sphingomonas sp.]
MTQFIPDHFAALIQKLERLAPLDDADRQAITALPIRLESVSAGTHLVHQGDTMTACCVLLEGYSFRYKLAANGDRQIVSFHLAADIMDLQHLLLPTADHGIQTLTDATIAWIPIAALQDIIRAQPTVGDAFWRDTLIDASIFREWVLNVGQRDAKSRIAHMLCEFAVRREAAGLGGPESLVLPMDQDHIADATGLTIVHVNRMLMALEDDGVISRKEGCVTIADWDGIRKTAGFDVSYLHMAA